MDVENLPPNSSKMEDLQPVLCISRRKFSDKLKFSGEEGEGNCPFAPPPYATTPLRPTHAGTGKQRSQQTDKPTMIHSSDSQ